MLKIYLKLLQKYRPSAGWTLAELMIAAAMTLVVVMVSGFGLVTILRENKVANATGEMQYDLNRATEFISEEIRSAKTIETDLADIKNYAPTFFAKHPDKTPILALKIEGVYERVIYYIDEVSDDDIWRGPAVIRRFGPDIERNGEYTTPETGQKNIKNPSKWTGDALIDMMLTTIEPEQKQCREKSGELTSPHTYITTDDEGREWHRFPANDDDVTGFFACVREDKQLVELHLAGTTIGEIGQIASTNPESRLGGKMQYNVTTMVHARSEAISSSGEDVPDFSLGSTLVIEEDGQATINVLYLAVPCEGDPDNTSRDVETSFVRDLPTDTGETTGEGPGSPARFEAGDEIAPQLQELDNCTSPDSLYNIQPTQTDNVKFVTNDTSKYPTLNSIIPDPSSTIINNLKKSNLIKEASEGSKTYYFSLADNQVLYFVEFEFEKSEWDDTLLDIIDRPQDDPPHFDDAILLVELSK